VGLPLSVAKIMCNEHIGSSVLTTKPRSEVVGERYDVMASGLLFSEPSIGKSGVDVTCHLVLLLGPCWVVTVTVVVAAAAVAVMVGTCCYVNRVGRFDDVSSVTAYTVRNRLKNPGLAPARREKDLDRDRAVAFPGGLQSKKS
jgi:hypothetical protein